MRDLCVRCRQPEKKGLCLSCFADIAKHTAVPLLMPFAGVTLIVSRWEVKKAKDNGPCIRCGESDRYNTGACRPCALRRSKIQRGVAADG